jgi:hypothetical protein
VPQHLWRWPNFSPAEIACRGTGQLKLHPEALDKLQALRDRLGTAVGRAVPGPGVLGTAIARPLCRFAFRAQKQSPDFNRM